MKRILALLLVALMLIGLCACGNGAQEGEQSAQGTETNAQQTTEQKDTSSKKEKELEYYVILNNDGEKHEVSYLFDMAINNKLKWDKFKEDGGYIEIVAPLEKIGSKTFYKDYNKTINSSITLKDLENSSYQLTVETSGLEDIIIDWEQGDIIKVKCKITNDLYQYLTYNLLYSFKADTNEIEIEKVQ